MALKNLSSQLDLVPGTNPVGNMEGQQGPSFDLGMNSSLLTDSLINQYQYNYGNSSDTVNASTLDLDGADNGNGTFDLGVDSILQQQSLLQIPNNSPYADLNGEPGPNFDLGMDSTFHIDSLTFPYSYQHGNSSTTIEQSSLDQNGIIDVAYNSLNGTSDSPFVGTGDHLVDLLTDSIYSTNTGLTYDSSPNNSPYQDLNGEQGPQFDNGLSSTLHEDSLTNPYTYQHGDSTANILQNNLDLNGADNGQGIFDLGTDSNLQQDSLLYLYQYTHGGGNNPFNNSTGVTGPSDLDLNGASGPNFDNGIGNGVNNLHTDLLAEIYESNINPLASYGAGQPGGVWPKVNPSPLQTNPSQTSEVYGDIDNLMNLSTTGYVNNLPT